MSQQEIKMGTNSPAVTVGVSPRYEISHAIRLLLDPQDGVHEEWCEQTKARLSRGFMERLEGICESGFIWPTIVDAIERSALDGSFFDVLKAHANIEPEQFRLGIIEAVYKDTGHAEDLIAGRISLADASKGQPEHARQWLSFVGLFPFVADAPISKFMHLLIDRPEFVRDEIFRLFNEFWDGAFDDTWEILRPQLEQSAQEVKGLLASSSLMEVGERLRLRVEIDDDVGELRALRSGNSFSFDTIDRIHFMPSAFNVNRLWALYDDPDTKLTMAVFPYFDPALSPLGASGGDGGPARPTVVEPRLIFTALGNTTRFAIADMLAKKPRSAAQLAKELGLTKATVSHHIAKLRSAGLLDESWAGGSVTLSLRRDVIEQLSTRVVGLFYGASED